MSYSAREVSAADGRPVELFTFARGSFIWRYTSADRDVTEETNLYLAAVIRRPKIEQGTEVARSVLSLVVPRTLGVLDQFRIVPPSDEVVVTIRQYHFGDSDIATIWQGVILGVKFNDDEAVIQVEPRSNGLRRMGLRRPYQRQCPFVLYGADCRLAREDFRLSGATSAVAGVSISVPEADLLADGYFDGGYIEWEIAVGVFERRAIAAHVGAVLTLDVQTVGLLIGQPVFLYPGCDHSAATCGTKFSNILNYGGMPYIPLKNPFGSDPVY